ncbi:TetR family transcriptional regulator [Leifsonia sp. Root112D2]|nr:TetR family transcriptional regulator [Leifsonia sp. Root112D2]
MEPQLPHLRTDAQENRDQILAAASAVFAETGLDVGMREIARRAGVGPATLYRRFPTKQALIDEAFSVELQACRAIVTEGCANPDAWRGFISVVERLTSLNVQNRGFVDAFTSSNSVSEIITEHRRELLRMLDRLARRAQQSGQLRCDFHIDDLTLMLRAGRGLASGRPEARAAAARRFARLAIDAFQAQPTRTPPA